MEFDFIYVAHTIMKALVLAAHLVENTIEEGYETLNTYFTNKRVSYVDEVISDDNHLGSKLLFDGDADMKGVLIRAIPVSDWNNIIL